MDRSINRREFLRNSGRLAGTVAALAGMSQLAALAADDPGDLPRLSDSFPRYTQFDPQVPVYCVTPKIDGCLHRFFNTSPISPSGRYLAVMRFLHEDRLSIPGDEAEIVLVDLKSGEWRVLARTKCFDTQLGAQVQWGATDHELFFNDMETRLWRPFGVRMDPLSGERCELDGTIFEVTRDGRYSASICLLRCAVTFRGYGAVVPTEVLPWNEGAASDDGVYLTDTATGKCRMIASYKDILDACGEDILPGEPERGGGYHGHQLSWNPQGTRIVLALAFNYPQPMTGRNLRRRFDLSLVTLKPDGSDIKVALPARVLRSKTGHHPCWCPDGEHISMNLALHGGNDLSLVRMRYDGQGLAPLTEAVAGSGHPSFHLDSRHLITDAYRFEPVGFKDGSVPIRWIDVVEGTERSLIRIHTKPQYTGPFNAMRVDPHPAWDRTYTRVAFNACPNGKRRVFIADMSPCLS